MSSCQRKLGLRGVIKLRAIPLDCGVTDRAILRKPRGDVIGIGSRLHVLQVAGDAVGVERRELIVHVAGRAGRGGVLARQRKPGLRGVIKLRAIPLDCGVTD